MTYDQSKIGIGRRIAVTVALALLLCAPVLGGLLRVSEASGVAEMRALATRPAWGSTSLAQWPAAFEAWLNDHFPLRSHIVQWHGIVRHRWLHEPSSRVVVGKDNWLFYSGEQTIADLVGQDRFTEPELAAWLQAIEGRRAWWREHGADYLFVIAPNKSSIYPEKLPAFVRSQVRPGKLDQLIDYLRAKNCGAPVVDLRSLLLSVKNQALLYWPTDSHWNAEGLAVSCDVIMRALQEMRVPLRVRDEAAWMRAERVVREGDCIGLLRLNGCWSVEPVTQLRLVAPPDGRIVETPLSGLAVWGSVSPWARPIAFERESGVGRTVMFCDSFFRVGGLAADTPAQSPLILNFRRFVSLWPWFGVKNVATYELLAATAEMEHPTLVIEQWTERYLRTPPPDHPEFQRARGAAMAVPVLPGK